MVRPSHSPKKETLLQASPPHQSISTAPPQSRRPVVCVCWSPPPHLPDMNVLIELGDAGSAHRCCGVLAVCPPRRSRTPAVDLPDEATKSPMESGKPGWGFAVGFSPGRAGGVLSQRLAGVCSGRWGPLQLRFSMGGRRRATRRWTGKGLQKRTCYIFVRMRTRRPARYPRLTENEISEKCPYCCNKCNCKQCLRLMHIKQVSPSSGVSVSRRLVERRELIKDLFKKWSSLDETHFLIETVSGGITNLLLKVSIREEKGNVARLTVRMYGPNTDFVIDRKRELKAIRYLSSAGFGAKLLGLFANGMVQSFIDARTLSPPDMSKPKFAAKIARELRKFHQVEIPGSKEPQLWNDIFKFLDKAGTIKFDDIEKQTRYESISFEEIHNEITQLKDLTDLLDAPVVFSHNDLLSGNLMLNDDEDKLYLIDFEYGSYNYRGYDIANHFNEYAGFECDYNLYPDNDSQYHFFRNYLQPETPEKVTDRDLEALYVETNTFMLASHIYWAIWALIQAKVSPIEFDYLGYFFLRYNEYKKQKERCFSVAHRYLSLSG